ncbi:MAG TPA: tRNA (adenosine(37)-N6)-threonylcarbamoyltransferase complex transferase subunit TsaD [candidate division Zixibacteria bacterium]|mgnify:CR=1 FL=1|nr:tRNA (adenosine(37)-N6)-threonylcarbamoyltransferase complex transferase subunit TsaD [candidate division Zixibacteria bacterium]
MLALGIETSCDETAAAVIADGSRVLANVILSQADHARFGGVVPEIASREHLKTIVPIYRQAMETAGVGIGDLGLIAATMGPGLVGPLLVGLTFAKGLAFAARLPFVPVNHLEGHLAANLLAYADLSPHHLTLVVSGGHTMLIEVNGFGVYRVLGRTQDDAAGEAFDKVAKLMDLGYPGGAWLDKLAQQGNPGYVRFPRAMLDREDYHFSFSGLKTAVALHLKKLSPGELARHKADIAASFQEAVAEVLAEKTLRAARDLQIHDVTVSGGVAANSRLRALLGERLTPEGRRLFSPPPELCTDNAAMIAAAGYFRYRKEGAGEMSANAVPYLRLT